MSFRGVIVTEAGEALQVDSKQLLLLSRKEIEGWGIFRWDASMISPIPGSGLRYNWKTNSSRGQRRWGNEHGLPWAKRTGSFTLKPATFNRL
jgi:hypothetical protein